MGDIVLSAGVRQNLLSLQSTSLLMSVTQHRLATGKKVNSALDNPTNYFTSQALSNRARDLNSLLDSIGQAQQTLKTADQGLTSLTKLVESAKSIAKQAQLAPVPSATYNLAITGNAAIAADTSRAVSTNTFASQVGSFTASNVASFTYNLAAGLGADGDTITINNGTTSVTFENDAGANGVASGNIGFANEAGFAAAVQSLFGGANVTYSAGTSLVVRGTNYTTNFAAPAGTLAANATTAAAVDGDKLTITQGSTTATLRYVASGASAAAGTFTTQADLNAAIAASAIGNAGPALNNNVLATTGVGGQVQLESNAAFTVGGTIATALNYGGSSFNLNYNATLAALTGTFSVAVGSGAPQTIDLAVTNTRAALATALGNLTGVTATLNGSNQVSIVSTSSSDVTISGTGTAASGLFNNANIGVNSPTVATGTNNAVRSGLQVQYNDLLTQIDALADDASYNGINLLNNDDLKVVFNESGSSILTINGVDFDSAGLGLTNLAGLEFQSNTTIDTVLTSLEGALTTLRAQASNFGTNLTTVQARQDFTKQLVGILETGADNLVLADTNEEGANMLALQTRQQLSTTALSLSAQADQAVLRLFG